MRSGLQRSWSLHLQGGRSVILQVPRPGKLQIQTPFKMAAANHCSPSRTFWGTCRFCLPFERVACKTHQSSPMHVLGPGRPRHAMNISELHGGFLAECSIGMYQNVYQNVSNIMQVDEIPVPAPKSVAMPLNSAGWKEAQHPVPGPAQLATSLTMGRVSQSSTVELNVLNPETTFANEVFTYNKVNMNFEHFPRLRLTGAKFASLSRKSYQILYCK